MDKLGVFLFFILLTSRYSAGSTVPESTRTDYASGMFEAFVTQSYGKSTIAFYQFDVAREKAKKAGDEDLKGQEIAFIKLLQQENRRQTLKERYQKEEQYKQYLEEERVRKHDEHKQKELAEMR